MIYLVQQFYPYSYINHQSIRSEIADELNRSELLDESLSNLLKTISNSDLVDMSANELLEAIKENDNQIHEAADVFYHLLVLLEGSGIKIEDVMKELKERQNGI